MPYFIGIVAALLYLGADDLDWTPVAVVGVLVVLVLALLAGGSERSSRRRGSRRPGVDDYAGRGYWD
jgi:hypothetical protein